MTFETAWHSTLQLAKVPFSVSTISARRTRPGSAPAALRTSGSRSCFVKAWFEYSQMKRQMKREALAKLNRQANESGEFWPEPSGVLARFWHSRGKGTAKEMERQSINFFGISRRFGRGGAI